MIDTAVEVFARQMEYAKRVEPLEDVLEQITKSMFKSVLDHRVPLIRYGRRKKRYRRLFPADIAAVRVTFNSPTTNTGTKATKMKCTCCDKPLNESAAVWLELDQRDGSYHDRGDIPPEKNQGGFPFGKTCAKKIRVGR